MCFLLRGSLSCANGGTDDSPKSQQPLAMVPVGHDKITRELPMAGPPSTTNPLK
jgi:hypothetical protein